MVAWLSSRSLLRYVGCRVWGVGLVVIGLLGVTQYGRIHEAIVLEFPNENVGQPLELLFSTSFSGINL